MPAWYNQAQTDIITKGGAALTDAPALGDTVAKNAITQLNDPNNSFTKSQNTLDQISSGAANPWIIDDSGNVTPNTSTAMGGLFQAQRDQLNQLMPEYTAPIEAGAIGSGGFGSLRGMTAVEKAKGDAFAKLNAAQLQAALTNQQTGATAAANLSTAAKTGIDTAMNVGQTEMNAPFSNAANYANLVSSMAVPTTTRSQVDYSPLSQLTSLGTAGKGALDSLTSLYKTPAGKNILDKLGFGSLLSSSSSGGSGGSGGSGTGFGDDGFDLGGSGIGDGTTGGGGGGSGTGFGDDGFDLGGSGIGDTDYGDDNYFDYGP
jgi:hypothetical protein